MSQEEFSATNREGKLKDQSSNGEKNNDQDVLLEVPKLNIGELKLEVDKLDAQVSLKAQLGNFVNIQVGTNINIENVKLEVKDVETEAHLKVRLKRVENIMNNALNYLEQHPTVLKGLDSVSKNEE